MKGEDKRRHIRIRWNEQMVTQHLHDAGIARRRLISFEGVCVCVVWNRLFVSGLQIFASRSQKYTVTSTHVILVCEHLLPVTGDGKVRLHCFPHPKHHINNQYPHTHIHMKPVMLCAAQSLWLSDFGSVRRQPW